MFATPRGRKRGIGMIRKKKMSKRHRKKRWCKKMQRRKRLK